MPALLLVLLLVLPSPAQPPLAGAWEGTIELPNMPLGIAVEFRAGSDGLTGTIDIPGQGAKGQIRTITIKDADVRFELVTGGPLGVFEGRVDGDRVTGTFTQGPFSGPFTLTRKAPPATAPPPSYGVEEVAVRNGEITLAGTLTRPEKAASPVPAVVLISGSGRHDRDEDVFGFKVFATLADHLTRQGIGVYRYDDRGVGKSTGNFATATTEDFASDAVAAAAHLRTLPGIDPTRVGLIGHSEGGMAAAIAAATSPEIGFIVMLAGTAVPGDQVLRQQARDLAIAQGSTPAQVERVLTAHRAATDAVLRGASPDEQVRLVRALVVAQIDAAPAEQLAGLGDDRAAFVEKTASGAAAQLASPWMKFMLAFDPAVPLRKVTVPVYAAFGELDVQVPPSLHEAPMREALRHNRHVTLVTYPGANHLFQQAKSGHPAEYATLEKAFVPRLPEDVAQWILEIRR